MSSDDWLEKLRDHPIFNPKVGAASGSSSNQANTLNENGFQRRNLIAVWQTDVIVAVGREIRILNLQDVSGSSHKSQRNSGSYKTIRCGAIDFDVQQLVVNQLGNLLAVVGTHELAVLNMPKASYSNAIEPVLESQGAKVGTAEYTPHSSPIVKVEWHPLGDSFTTLLVLTQDSLLREYDVNSDLTEPQQTVSFLPKPYENKKRRGAFGIGAQTASTAVSFTTGCGQADWGPTTLYGLMSNGDVWAICPYLPKRSSITQSYVEALGLFLDKKAERLRTALDPTSASSSISSSVQARALAAARLGTQQRWLRAVASQITEFKQLNPRDMDVDASTQKFTIVAPDASVVPSAVARQGPLLLQPAPEPLECAGDLGVDVEDVACDLAVFSLSGRSEAAGHTVEKPPILDSFTCLMIMWKEGRADVCLEVEKIEAQWDSSSADSEPHTLMVYESIDLGFISALTPSESSPQPEQRPYDALLLSQPVLTVDPLDTCVLCIHHALGVHRISCRSWMEELASALLPAEPEGALQRFWNEGHSSDVEFLVDTLRGGGRAEPPIPVVGLAVVADIRIPYSLLALTDRHQLAAIPLGEATLQVDEAEAKVLAASSSKPAVSLLHEETFDVPEGVFRNIAQKARQGALLVLAKERIDPRDQLKQIDSNNLRALGSLVDVYATAKNDVEKYSDRTESRLEVQVQEVKRQLKRIQDIITTVKEMRGDAEMIPTPSEEGSASTSMSALRDRVEQVAAKQEDYIVRLDQVTQTLMAGAHPELSTMESNWISELERMRQLVGGEGVNGRAAGGMRSLSARLAAAAEQFSALKPSLQHLQHERNVAGTSSPLSAGRFGQSQVDKIGHALEQESASLGRVVQQISDLTAKMSRLKMMSGVPASPR